MPAYCLIGTHVMSNTKPHSKPTAASERSVHQFRTFRRASHPVRDIGLCRGGRAQRDAVGSNPVSAISQLPIAGAEVPTMSTTLTADDGAAWTELTGFQRDLLVAIYERDEPHGLALKSALQDRYGTEVNHGRLYPNLDDLVESGLVKKGTIDQRTNSYEITLIGKSLVENQAHRLDSITSERAATGWGAEEENGT